jgi:hypothetical protein
MFERLLSRLRGHRRQAAKRRNRGRARAPGAWAWPRDAQAGRSGGPGWPGGGSAGEAPGPAAARPPGAVEGQGPAEPWGEASGRHRRAVTVGDVPGPAEPEHDTPAGTPAAGPARNPAQPGGPGQPGGPVQSGPVQSGGPVHTGRPARAAPSTPVGGARARIRKQAAPGPFGSPVRTQPPQQRAGTGSQPPVRRSRGRRPQRPAVRGQAARGQAAQSAAQDAAARPWYELAAGWQRPDGSQHCGSLEPLVHRQWDAAKGAPAAALHAISRLADLPQKLKDMLATAVDAIYVGPGGVPELDDMTRLRGVPLPSGRATWDACAGAYGDRKIVVGTRPSPSPDVMCHEVGHAIDDSDAPPGRWQSDSAEFRMLYDQCLSHLVSGFHRQPGALGRREFFADAFAAIASRQRPALVDMLGGSTRLALNVMLYYNRRYGI